MKFLTTTAAALLFGSLPLAAQQPANAYDLLGQTLAPLAAIFAPASAGAAPRTMALRLELESLSLLSPEQAAGTSLELEVQPPQRARLRGKWGGQVWTVGRNGQEVWVDTGGSLPLPGSPPEAPKRGKGGGLPPIELPFPPQQLLLLPILFQVTDQGTFDGKRVLDLRLMPELARSLKVEGWAARIAVDPGAAGTTDAPRLTRLELAGPQWRGAARVESYTLSANLPESHWEAPPGATRLSGAQAREWAMQLWRKTRGE